MSVLNKNNFVPAMVGDDKYININYRSNSDLGKRLSPRYPFRFMTVLGMVGSIRNFMNYTNTVGYPYHLLCKPVLTEKNISLIPKERIKFSNYWASVAYAVCCRIKSDPELIAMMKENNKEYTAMTTKRVNTKNDKGITCTTDKVLRIPIVDVSMGRYLSIIRYISNMIKTDKFTEENISKFITSCKDDPSVDIFDGMANAVTNEEV